MATVNDSVETLRQNESSTYFSVAFRPLYYKGFEQSTFVLQSYTHGI